MKSERLKKLETEVEELEQIMSIGIYPKRDIEKGLEEIRMLKAKIEEEKERIRFMKENGEVEEYVTPKRNAARGSYAEAHTLPDMEVDGGMTEGFEMTENFDVTESDGDDGTESGASEVEVTSAEEDEDDNWMSRSAQSKRFSQLPDEDSE